MLNPPETRASPIRGRKRARGSWGWGRGGAGRSSLQTREKPNYHSGDARGHGGWNRKKRNWSKVGKPRVTRVLRHVEELQRARRGRTLRGRVRPRPRTSCASSHLHQQTRVGAGESWVWAERVFSCYGNSVTSRKCSRAERGCATRWVGCERVTPHEGVYLLTGQKRGDDRWSHLNYQETTVTSFHRTT